MTFLLAAAATAALNHASAAPAPVAGFDGQPAAAAAGDRGADRPATLSGFVRDRSDGELLPNATVAVGDRQMGTLSNAEGYYALPGIPAGTWAIAVSYIGYAVHRDTVRLAPGQELRRDIELDPEELEMEAVVVEAEAEQVENELSQQTSVVVLPMTSLQKMPAMGEPDLLRSLQLLPGVQTASDYSSGLYVRGGGPDQTGILLDQVRLYNPSHAFGFFSTFNPDAIKDVTFYKGAYPARYGGNLGGVLDVQNRDGNRRRFSNRGGVSLISSRLMSEGPLGEGSWMVAGRRTYIDPALRAVRNAADGLDGLAYWFYDLNAKINTQLTPGDNLMVSAYAGDDHLDISVGDSTNTLGFGNQWGNRALTGRWTHLFSPALFGRAFLPLLQLPQRHPHRPLRHPRSKYATRCGTSPSRGISTGSPPRPTRCARESTSPVSASITGCASASTGRTRSSSRTCSPPTSRTTGRRPP